MKRIFIVFNIFLALICIMIGILLGNFFYISEKLPVSVTQTVDDSMPTQFSDSSISPSFLIPSIDDSLLISDNDAQSLYKITRNGSVKWIIDEKSAEPYGFWHISGVGSDKAGNVYVSDQVTSRIFKFNKEGTLLDTWGNAGINQGEFQSPQGITIFSSSGKKEEQIYVCDAGNRKIEILSTNGSYIGGFSVPITVDSVITRDPPKPGYGTTGTKTQYVIPQKGANPRFVERSFDIQTSNKVIPVSFKVNRSVYLGAQKISINSQDIATKNPEEWVPVITRELSDPTTQETIRTTLEKLLYEGHSRGFDTREMVEFIAHFIQQLPLTDESENRHPVEIIHDKKGNSFDKALFLYGLLQQDGYDVVYLAFPGFPHAGVGIRMKEHVSSDIFKTYKDSNGDEYLYINPDGPSFFGGLATTYKSSDPFVIHLLRTKETQQSFGGYIYSLYVVESIINLAEKYQFLVDKEKEEKGEEAKKIKTNYQKIKSVLDYIEKNPSNTEGAYMRIKNSKVNDIIV